MNGKTESTSNSIKFAPMPMSALMATLRPLQTQFDSPDTSFTSDDSDDSFKEIATSKTPNPKINKSSTPQYKKTKDIKAFASERKIHEYDLNKENNNQVPHRAIPIRDYKSFSNERKETKPSACPNSGVKRNVLMPHDTNAKEHVKKDNSALKKTPEPAKILNSCQKKVATPKIKSGVRRFTPGSERSSHRKSPLQTVIHNRDKVRCELFRQNQQKEEYLPIVRPQPEEPTPVSIPPISVSNLPPSASNSQPSASNLPPSASNLPPSASNLLPSASNLPPPVSIPAPVPDTPSNRKLVPPTYAATPSYPQGIGGNNPNNSRILYKSGCIKNKKYLYIKKLGAGGSSEVYKVLEVGTSSEYAVKHVNLGADQDLVQGYLNEVKLLKELQNSERVIRLFDYEYDRQSNMLRMVLEVGETDLSSFLRARGAGLQPALVLHYWEEMLLAVNYIHEHGVIHADLKPANFVLVCGRLKLIDFGIASAVSGDATSVVRVQAAGTYSYISPEAIAGGAGGYGNSNNIQISYRSDVWSLGCILYSMVYGHTPLSHANNLAKLSALLDPHLCFDYPPVDHLPATLISNLKWCLTYNARSRPTVRELLEVKHLQPGAPLPPPLLERLRQHVSVEEYRLLAQART